MQNEKKYFASANTEKGFVSYFDEIYGVLDRVYIIKGGPGTGKSHFIRNIADTQTIDVTDINLDRRQKLADS